MTTSQKLKAKISSQIEKILTKQGEASDVVIAVYTRNKCVEITLNNDNPFTIAYNKRRDILDDSKKWHKLLNDKVNRELKNKSHNSLYIVYVKNDTTLPELTGLENVAIKKIVSENTLFCYATKDSIKQFIKSNKNKIICEMNSYIETDPQENKSQDISTTSPAVLSAALQRIGARTSSPRQDNPFEYSNDVHIFVLDGGIYKHRDLTIDIENSRNFVPDENNVVDATKWEDTIRGHGTHVAGIIAANGIGVAPGIKLIAHRVSNNNGSSQVAWQIESLTAIETFKKKNINTKIVVNISLGGAVQRNDIGPPVSQRQTFQVNQLKIQKLIKMGITFVTSAGNFTHNVVANTSGRIPDIIAVASFVFVEGDKSRRNEKNNDIGFTSNYGPAVDIMAPGVDRRSTEPNNSYGIRSGTSMAAPTVTGAIALMLSVQAKRDPTVVLTPEQIKNKLRDDAINSFNDNKNPRIKLENRQFYRCWRQTFTEEECNTWWRDTLPETYPYSLFIGSYTKNGETVQNY